MKPQRVWFLCRFGLKTDTDFDHFDLESGMLFEGTTGVYERICRFNSKWIRIFCLTSFKADDLISTYTRIENGFGFKRLGLKTSVEINIF